MRPDTGLLLNAAIPLSRIRLRDRKGADPNEWPEDLLVREFPDPDAGLALRPEVEERLRRSLETPPEALLTPDEMEKRLGLGGA